MQDYLSYFGSNKFAADNWAGKYALKDPDGKRIEATPDDMHLRLAAEFAKIEALHKNGLSVDAIYEYFKDFFGIIPQGSVMAMAGNPFQVGSLSNCIVLPKIFDSYGGIMYADQQLTQLMKRRCGVGGDLSPLRPAGSKVKNGALSSTGVPSFMERYSNTTREVALEGRRGALMLMLDIRHPEVEEFSTKKIDRTKVTGANISVKISDEFMNAVKDEKPFVLRYPIDAISETEALVWKQKEAKTIWDVIISAAHDCAEPGIVFWDRQHYYSPSSLYPEFENIATNPCLDGDTLVAVADGRNAVTIRELAEQNVEFPVYSMKNGRVSIQKAIAFKTKENTKTIKVILDDDSTFICTPDHLIMKRNGEYVKAEELKENDSLMPFNSYVSNKNYRQIASNTGRDRRQYRMISEYYGLNVDSKIYAIHHKDFNSLNDSILNLEIMTHVDHKELHASRMRGSLNPIFKLKNSCRFENYKANNIFYNNKGELNSNFSGISNEELEKIISTWILELGYEPSSSMYVSFASENNLPLSLSSHYRKSYFNGKSWLTEISNKLNVKTFNNAYEKRLYLYNHKVKQIVEVENRDVYDLTVEETHNFAIITSAKDSNFITSSGVFVHNCAEIAMGHDSCRLIANNMFSCIIDPFTPNAKFDFKRWYQLSYDGMKLSDDLVELELKSIERILEKIDKDPEPDYIKAVEKKTWEDLYSIGKKGRRTGLGFTALGDTLAALGLGYDSKEGLKMVDQIMRTKLEGELDSTIGMAEDRGAFPAFDAELEAKWAEDPRTFFYFLKNEFPEQWKKMQKVGRRNISWSTIAPTGTLSTVSALDINLRIFGTTSGLEPVFSLFYIRRKKINANAENVRVDFVDANGDSWQEFAIVHDGFKLYLKIVHGIDNPEELTKAQLEEYAAQSPYAGSTAPEIDWIKRVEMQSVIQKYITHSISSTINLPKDVSVEKVGEIYMKAWELGLKGITVYRDGSRDGVLITDNSKKDVNEFGYHDAIKRPENLPAELHYVVAQGQRYGVVIGLMNGLPYEIFAFPESKNVSGVIQGVSKKVRQTKYRFESKDVTIEELQLASPTPEEQILTRLISGMLRHGTDPKFIVEQIDKCPLEIVSFGKAIMRVLKKYVSEQSLAARFKCKDCGSTNVRFEEGCSKCVDCGSSKCG